MYLLQCPLIMDPTEAFRAEYRATKMGGFYSGWLHFSFTAGGCLIPIAIALFHVHHPSWRELLVLPLTFLYANVFEYVAHRGPMHHPSGLLAPAFQRHTLEHHRFYTDRAMEALSSRDFKMVLFPPLALILVIGVSVPVAVALYTFVSPNTGYLFLATGLAYFLNYEIFHWAYHLPASAWIRRVPGLNRLRRLHLNHHNPAWMTRFNFNVTYPICDRIFGTYRQ